MITPPGTSRGVHELRWTSGNPLAPSPRRSSVRDRLQGSVLFVRAPETVAVYRTLPLRHSGWGVNTSAIELFELRSCSTSAHAELRSWSSRRGALLVTGTRIKATATRHPCLPSRLRPSFRNGAETSSWTDSSVSFVADSDHNDADRCEDNRQNERDDQPTMMSHRPPASSPRCSRDYDDSLAGGPSLGRPSWSHGSRLDG